MTSAEDLLRTSIVAKLASGGLRSDRPVRTQLSKGWDHACAACESAIKTTHVECTTQFADRVVLHFHRDCYYAWDAHRTLVQ